MAKFIGYLPASFPNSSDSIEAYKALIDAKVDILEIGIPYSDPVMDGQSIQNASKLALDNGFKVNHVFYIIRAVKEYINSKIRTGQIFRTPEIYIMTYFNIILKFGMEMFLDELNKCQVEGIIVPDLLPDEADEFLKLAHQYHIKVVFLTALNSSDDRLDLITKKNSGFVYMTSLLGTTGIRENNDYQRELTRDSMLKMITRIKNAQSRSMNWTPVYAGLGISNAADCKNIADIVDGVIVGSALVKALENNLEELYKTACELAIAIHGIL